MKLTIDKRFLLFPVCHTSPSRNIAFLENDILVFDLDICMDAARCDALYPVDVSRLAGRTLTLCGLPEGVQPTLSDSEPAIPDLYREKCRPQLHFSAKRGWLNDPNGLVWDGENYHLFFQHNPAGRIWGNMHWGHAVSSDLIHWEQLPGDALHPDATGTMYSGCGVLDADNVSGLGDGSRPPLLFYYTAAGGVSELSRAAGNRFTQRIAFSTDGGVTLHKLPGAPTVDHIAASNRDPKVVHCAQQNCWYMALFLNEHEFALLRSADLLHWELFQRLELPGDAECPDFYPLRDETGEEYWVLSAASDCYLVGKLDDAGRFVPTQPVQRLHHGAHSYASQTFFNTADGQRIRLGWGTVDLPDMPFNSCMNTPIELTLRRCDGLLRLCAQPIAAFESLRLMSTWTPWDRESGDRVRFAPTALFELAWDFILRQDAVLTVCGLELRLCAKGHTLYCREGDKEYSVPLFPDDNGRVQLRMIADVTSLEIYPGHGEAFAVFALPHPGTDERLIRVHAEEGALAAEHFTLYPLESIW